MHLVTFLSGPGRVDGRLVDALGEIRASRVVGEGWMLGTNCVPPRFVVDDAGADDDDGDRSGPVRVDYSVYEYRRIAGRDSASDAAGSSSTAVHAPEPVGCEIGLGSVGIFSDWSRRQDTRCFNERAVRAEGVCGALYGWQTVSREEYLDLCGGRWPGDGLTTTRSPQPTSSSPGAPSRRRPQAPPRSPPLRVPESFSPPHRPARLPHPRRHPGQG